MKSCTVALCGRPYLANGYYNSVETIAEFMQLLRDASEESCSHVAVNPFYSDRSPRMYPIEEIMAKLKKEGGSSG